MAVTITGWWHLIHDPERISSRRGETAGKGILASDAEVGPVALSGFVAVSDRASQRQHRRHREIKGERERA
eukprot:8307057-Pyramimonas_sp.AAC.1